MAEQSAVNHGQIAGQAARARFGALNLTEQQKQQAHRIFASEREAAHSIRQQLREERKSVQSAIQAGKPAAEVGQLAKNEGPALAEMARMRAAAFDRFYAVLMPAQRQELASLHQERRQHRASAAAPEGSGPEGSR